MTGETAQTGSVFAWQGVGYGIGKGKTEKQILTDISGELRNGELCAIIGPSGSGKTSLLNILAGRIQSKGNSRRVDGTVHLDGQPLVGVALRKRIAYVKQEDLMTATYTPRESMLFSAALRLPRSVPLADKKAKVEKMLEELGLLGCANTFCGDDMLRGISGGEKKRTCIGIELVMDPKLIFLDEPTSGLDSFSAYSVVKQLDVLASKEGCNVLCTIHQPSSEVFHLFHKVILLIPGYRLFFGTVSELSQKLSSCGLGCPNEYNLADHAMFLIQTKPHEELLQLAKRMDSGLQNTLEGSAKAASFSSQKEATAGFCGQLWALSVREGLNLWRNKPGLIASVLIPAILNFFFAMIFFQVGDINAKDYDENSHFGGMTQVAIGGMFGAAQPLLLRFPLDRGIFLREYATGTYGAAPYFISKSMVEIPQSFLNACIVWLVSYWMMGLNGNFLYYVVIFTLSGTAAASTALLVGCVASNPEVANQAAPAIFVPQLLFAGFFIRTEQIPDWLSWFQYICSLKYAMNLFVLTEFGSNTYGSRTPETTAAHELIINRNDIDRDLWWLYVIILVALIVVFRSLSIVALIWRASTFF